MGIITISQIHGSFADSRVRVLSPQPRSRVSVVTGLRSSKSPMGRRCPTSVGDSEEATPTTSRQSRRTVCVEKWPEAKAECDPAYHTGRQKPSPRRGEFFIH